MTHARSISAIAVLAVLGLAPASAQTPLFNDGTALGGSLVFSEGFNPLGNSARFDQPKPQPAWCFTYVDGDQRASDNASGLASLGAPSPSISQLSDALRQLSGSPWGLRTRSYGLAFLADSVNGSFTREEFSSVMVAADTQPANLDTPTAFPANGINGTNGTTADVRRALVDRIATGVVSKGQGITGGFTFRLEQWKLGMQSAAVNPAGIQVPLISGTNPFEFRDTPLGTTTLAVDFGLVFELFEGLRLGGSVNRLNAKRLWDVEEKPQTRVGLQMDIGSLAKLALESDLNETMRMPFPVKQRTSAASLRISASRTITLLLGAERRTLGDSSVTRGGATLQLNFPGYCLAFGMQYSKDHPLKGFTAVFN